MQKVKISDYIIEFEDGLKSYNDVKNKRIAILSEEDDEIHITIELNEWNKLILHPRWNINITYIDDKYLLLTTNK